MIAMANTATLTSTRISDMALPSVDAPGSSPTRPADHADDDLARPDRGLQGSGDDEQDVGQASQLGRNGRIAADDVDRRGDHEQDGGLGEDAADDALPAHDLRVVGEDAMPDPAHHQHDPDDPGGDQSAHRQPVEVVR